jgi:hypothetical protein
LPSSIKPCHHSIKTAHRADLYSFHAFADIQPWSPCLLGLGSRVAIEVRASDEVRAVVVGPEVRDGRLLLLLVPVPEFAGPLVVWRPASRLALPGSTPCDAPKLADTGVEPNLLLSPLPVRELLAVSLDTVAV